MKAAGVVVGATLLALAGVNFFGGVYLHEREHCRTALRHGATRCEAVYWWDRQGDLDGRLGYARAAYPRGLPDPPNDHPRLYAAHVGMNAVVLGLSIYALKKLW